MPAPTPADDLFEAYFDLPLAGALLLAPVLAASGAVVDFTYARVNAAARQLLALPEQPTESMLTRFPKAGQTGVLAFYQQAWAAGGELRQTEFSYDYQGTTSTTRLAARRVGQQVLVSLTDTNSQPRSTVEKAAQLTQDRAEADGRQQELQRLFAQAPVGIAVYQGPRHVIELANDLQLAIWGFTREQALGRGLFELLPEVAGQGFEEQLAGVLATGQPFVGTDLPASFTRHGVREQLYVSFVLQPLREADGHIGGVMVVVTDTTAQVLARRQADAMQAALLAAAQRQVQQREELFQVFEQAPAAIVLLREPNHRIEYVNPTYAGLFPGIALRGRLLTEAHPSAAADGILVQLDRVYATGEPYVGEELALELALVPGQPTQTHYFNYTYQPYREDGRIVGVSIFAYDVTAPVLARRATAEALVRQQAELGRVFEQAPVGIYLMRGPEFVVELINPMAADMWGSEPTELLGRSWPDIAPGLRGSKLLAAWQQVLATGQPHYQREVRYELRRAHRGKPDVGYFTVTYQPWYDEQGQVTGIIAVGLEVTEQVLARQAVEQLNQELETRVQERTQQLATARAEAEHQRGELERVFEQAPVAIAVYRGPRYVIELANSTVARLWGRTREQLIGKGLFEALPEVAGMGFEELLDGVMATGQPHMAHAMEAQHERDGHLETVYWDFVYVPTYEADGRIGGAMVVASEVTEQVLARRRVEQLNQELETRVQERTRQLTEQQALLRQILGQVPAAIATLSGPAHRFSFFNELYQALVANRAELGQAVVEALPEVVEQGFIDLLDRVYQTGEPFVGTDMALQLRDARTGHERQRYVDFIYQPLFDAQHRVQGILAFVLDVTDRALARQQAEESQAQVQQLNEELAAINEELRATNEELHASNTQLMRTNSDLDTFVYTASHDLKAPIANIEGLLAALRDYLPPAGAGGPADAMIPRLLSMMDGAVTRFQQTLTHLTDITRLQYAHEQPAELIDLPQLLEDVRLDLASLLDSTQGQLLLDAGTCPTVYFSPINLRSIVYNLLSNALKYHAPDRPPVVRLQASCDAEHVVLAVHDNGLGLSGQQQAHLFGLFKRLHTHVEGSGVGLYMLKKIVENAGGTIGVESKSAIGSTFRVVLPRRWPAR